MLGRAACAVVLGVGLVGSVMVTTATQGQEAAVKQQVEDIFRTVDQFMAGKKPDSKSEEARATEKIFVDHEDSEELDDDKPRGPPRIPATSGEAGLRPVTFPIGIIMAENLYPLVVGKSVESGRPFVMNLNKQHALVVARSATGGDYKLLIPFPVMVGSHPGQEEERNSPTLGNPRYQPGSFRRPLRGSFLDKFNHPDSGEEPRPREYAQNYQSYRPLSGEDLTDQRATKPLGPSHGKKYLKPLYKNLKGRPEKDFNSHVERPETIHSYNIGYTKPVSYIVLPKTSRKNVPMAYRQGQPGLYHYRATYSPPRHPYHGSPPPAPPHQRSPYPPVNYAGAYSSVPKDFRPSPYLGNITEDSEPPPHSTGRPAKPQEEHYENYDDRPYDFTEQDYLDSLNSPDAHAHSSSGGVHHVTHHVDDYLGKIYEEMYYRLPPPPAATSSSDDNDRQGTEEFPSANFGVKITAFRGQNKTDTSRPKTLTINHKEVKQKPTGANKSSIINYS